MSEYENLRTADIIAEALLDWKVDLIFGDATSTTTIGGQYNATTK